MAPFQIKAWKPRNMSVEMNYQHIENTYFAMEKSSLLFKAEARIGWNNIALIHIPQTNDPFVETRIPLKVCTLYIIQKHQQITIYR